MKKLFMRLAPLAMVTLFIIPLGCDRDGEETTMLTPDDTPTGLGILEAARTGVAPTIDGVASAGEWDGANAIYVPVEVPDIEEFPGYAGRGYQVKLRAKFDNENIYFLAEWDDPAKNLDREAWYFDTGSSSWKQEAGRPLFDEDGNQTRPAFYEDKLSLMFEASPVAGFASQGCWAACHTGLSPTSNDGGKVDLKYTNHGGEVLDMWHWKSVRNTSQGTFDDQYTDSQRSAKNGGRHSDVGVNSYVNNKATVDGFTVPKYVIPDASSRYYWVVTDGSNAVSQPEGLAYEVVAASADGKLTLSNGTVIDPVLDSSYQRNGDKLPPSIYTRPPSGDRADIEAASTFSGGWTLEFKRALVTNSAGLDVQFNDLGAMYPMGVAVFDNAQIAHAVSSLPVMLAFERQ